MRVPDGFQYVEDQSLSVVPPGLAANSCKHTPQLYSIASTHYGDTLDGMAVRLCVHRAKYFNPVTGAVDLAKKGVCSDFLCNASPVDKVAIAGPTGKTMLLPKDWTCR